MRRHIAPLAAVLLLSTAPALSGCVTAPVGSPPSAGPVQTISLGAKRALAQTQSLYNHLGAAYIKLRASGAVPDAVNNQVKPLSQTASDALLAADDAAKKFDAARLDANLAAAMAAINGMRALVPGLATVQ